MKIPALDTGKMLHEFLRKKCFRQAPLARDLGRSPETIAGYLKRSSIHTRILLELSMVLKYNFFKHIGAMLPDEFPPDLCAAKDEEIAGLNAEIDRLKDEIRVLKEALKLVGGRGG